ncbi:hypothetical protein SALBM135S_02891 [Streptomyces alboniger]
MDAASRPPDAPAGRTPDAPARPSGHALLAGRTAVITAAAGAGIGGATARRFLEEGARIVLGDAHPRRTKESVAALAEEFGADRVDGIPCDVTEEAQVRSLFDLAEARHGGLDIVVNNAGLGGTAELTEMTDEQWAKVIDVTLTGTFRCTRAALRRLRTGARGGVVVNNASVLGWRAEGVADDAGTRRRGGCLPRRPGHPARLPLRARHRLGRRVLVPPRRRPQPRGDRPPVPVDGPGRHLRPHVSGAPPRGARHPTEESTPWQRPTSSKRSAPPSAGAGRGSPGSIRPIWAPMSSRRSSSARASTPPPWRTSSSGASTPSDRRPGTSPAPAGWPPGSPGRCPA